MKKEDRRIQPLGDRVLLRLTEPVKQIGRILIPEQYAKKPQAGEVLAVGPDCKKGARAIAKEVAREMIDPDGEPGETSRIQPGQVAIFNQYAGTVCPDDDTLLLIREDELLGVYEP